MRNEWMKWLPESVASLAIWLSVAKHHSVGKNKIEDQKWIAGLKSSIIATLSDRGTLRRWRGWESNERRRTLCPGRKERTLEGKRKWSKFNWDQNHLEKERCEFLHYHREGYERETSRGMGREWGQTESEKKKSPPHNSSRKRERGASREENKSCQGMSSSRSTVSCSLEVLPFAESVASLFREFLDRNKSKMPGMMVLMSSLLTSLTDVSLPLRW